MYSGFHEKFPTYLLIMVIRQRIYILKNIYEVILVGNTNLLRLTWGALSIIISEFHFSFVISLSSSTSAPSFVGICYLNKNPLSAIEEVFAELRRQLYIDYSIQRIAL